MKTLNVTQEITLEVGKKSNPTQYAKQLDKGTRFLKCTIQDNGENIPLHEMESVSACFSFSNYFGVCDIYGAEIDGDTGKVTVELSQFALSVPGELYCEIDLMQHGNVLSTSTFGLNIEKRALNDEQIVVQPEFTELLETLAEAKEATQKAEDSGKHASEQGDYAKAQGDRVEELIGSGSGSIAGKDGHSPYISEETKTWWEFDDDTQEWKDTGIEPKGKDGDRGDPFEYSDFTPEQLLKLKGDKGDSFKHEDFTEEQLATLKGDKGKAFEHSDFTEEQLANLKGDGFTYNDFTTEQLERLKGDKGKAFEHSDFTEEQLANLKGDKGDPFAYEDFTPEQLLTLKGEKGKDFLYSDFTEEQLATLKGEKGDPGAGGKTAYESAQSGGFVGTEASFNTALNNTDILKKDGDGSKFLNDKGEYQPAAAGGGTGGDIVETGSDYILFSNGFVIMSAKIPGQNIEVGEVKTINITMPKKLIFNNLMTSVTTNITTSTDLAAGVKNIPVVTFGETFVMNKATIYVKSDYTAGRVSISGNIRASGFITA